MVKEVMMKVYAGIDLHSTNSALEYLHTCGCDLGRTAPTSLHSSQSTLTCRSQASTIEKSIWALYSGGSVKRQFRRGVDRRLVHSPSEPVVGELNLIPHLSADKEIHCKR